MTSPCPCQLDALQVLVTRPKHQSEELAQAIEHCGAIAICQPLIEIKPFDIKHCKEQLSKQADDLIFVSPNAVAYALAHLQIKNERIIAIGSATEAKLNQAGYQVAIKPEGQPTTENLLRYHALEQLEGRRMKIICGRGGRELLEQELSRRGAQVERAELYRREAVTRLPQSLLENWQEQVDAILLTACSSIDALVKIDNSPHIFSTPAIVISHRIQRHAKALGFNRLINAKGPSPSAIIEALCRVKTPH